MKITLFLLFLILSLCIGVLLGIYTYHKCSLENTTILITAWQRLVELGTILAGVGAIAAVCIGYLALTSWKQQSRGESTLKRLLVCQENVSILCCEFLDRTTSVMDKEKEELYQLAKTTDNYFAILSRQISPNDEILEMKKLLFMPRVRIRDYGALWEDEKAMLRSLEKKLAEYVAKF